MLVVGITDLHHQAGLGQSPCVVSYTSCDVMRMAEQLYGIPSELVPLDYHNKSKTNLVAYNKRNVFF